MPQDSTIVVNSLSDTSQLTDSAHTLVQDTFPGKPLPREDAFSGHPYAMWFYFAILLSIIMIPTIIRVLRARIHRKQRAKEYESRQVVFDNLLQHYNPYYKSLTGENKDRFMKRVLAFMEEKDFQYIEIEQEDIMPLLIGSAAIQLTFGLAHFMLDHFKTIYVVRDNYTYGLYNVPFEGHVNDEGIYLSWNNFLREFNDYTDGENVGLHELAHALTYVNFTVDNGRDDWFYDNFPHFSKIARPVFEKMQAGENMLFNKYAATNYNEFWAVCVETFFERGEKFCQELPDLYFALAHLLNQDPLTKQKIISLPQNN